MNLRHAMSTVAVVLTLLNLTACKENLQPTIKALEDPQRAERLQTYIGTWKRTNYDYEEILEIQDQPPRLAITYSRNVGQEGDARLPDPSVCKYRVDGTELSIGKDEATAPEFPLFFHFNPESYTLVQDPENSPACDIFIQRENDEIRTNPYSEYLRFRIKGDQLEFRSGMIFGKN